MKKKIIAVIALILLFVGGVSVGLGTIGTLAFYSWHLSDKERLLNHKSRGMVLQDNQGEPFFTFYEGKPQNLVSLEEIPPIFTKAIIAVEDKEFYNNPGFSLRGTLRAFRLNLISGTVVQGGSTISQQVIKNTLLTPKKNLLRKMQEIILAYDLNKRYSKDEILEMYMNTAYFGEGAVGVADAAQIYFGKSVSQLTTAESTILVALLPAPSTLSPLNDGGLKAKERQRLVLDQLVTEGYLTQWEAEKAYNQSVSYTENSREINRLAPHFALYIKDQLVKQFGEDEIIRQGLTVTTTLDPDLQNYAEAVVATQVEKLRRNRVSNGAAVIMNPKTGDILTMVGSSSWYNQDFGKMNMVTTPRQSGSAFKPLVYSQAINERLITPATILDDIPKEYPIRYKPVNYDRKFRGPVTVRRALANSLNIPSVEIMSRLGVPRVLSYANQLGIESLGNNASMYGLSLVLGSGEITLLELTSAYSAFAAEGMHVKPRAITKITDKYGNIIYESRPVAKQVMRPETAFLITSILSDRNARREVFGQALNTSKIAAVKTGTTNKYRDALTVGYTSDYVVGVWVGNNNNQPMDSVAGSLGAAPIWKSIIEYASRSVPNQPFEAPDSIEVATICPYVGRNTKLAATSMYREYFIPGTKPPSKCELRPTPPVENEEVNPEEKEIESTSPPVPENPPPEWNDD